VQIMLSSKQGKEGGMGLLGVHVVCWQVMAERRCGNVRRSRGRELCRGRALPRPGWGTIDWFDQHRSISSQKTNIHRTCKTINR